MALPELSLLTESYGITFDGGSFGSMICKLSETGSKIGNINATYELSMLGRSQANLNLFKVSRNGQTFMFQSFAEIHSITPAIGSTEGGTIVTVAGRFFDETKSEAVVKIGGMGCEVMSINESVITCRTPRAPDKIKPKYVASYGRTTFS
ncbi:fibrocystin-L-like [Pecten maximus]|uniref:fibrocystin-L-like n=1 Tax=Pecten maximus TaxID=6579 RepID=UPI001458A29E|nr:fibrocystin-L-like [Pecten maximus]